MAYLFATTAIRLLLPVCRLLFLTVYSEAVPDMSNYYQTTINRLHDGDVILQDTRSTDERQAEASERRRNYMVHADDSEMLSGNVLVYSEGKLWAVCDDGWSRRAANIVCRMLGYRSATTHTMQSYFGLPSYDIGFDDVTCVYGNEQSLLDCRHSELGHHDCDRREAAGVVCTRGSRQRHNQTSSAADSRPSGLTNYSNRTASVTPENDVVKRRRTLAESNNVLRDMMRLSHGVRHHRNQKDYRLRVVNGRSPNEGRVEIQIGASESEWGAICSDHWTMLEARVACRQAGLGLASTAIKLSYFGGESLVKMVAGIECNGDESLLTECRHSQYGTQAVTCPEVNMVAGVICAVELPDLVPNATMLQTSTYIQDQPMYYLQCAMEENCAAASAFRLRATDPDWYILRRRLMRFSLSTWNFGTADFIPAASKSDWEWHLCHMHYHSMEVFAHYDILDLSGNRVAEGHKASFCLEDVRCMPGSNKKFACRGYADQGITVGCADDYLHDIDCQWIDITDVQPGNYTFKVNINPDFLVGELDYSNNAATCDLSYTGNEVLVTNCLLGRV